MDSSFGEETEEALFQITIRLYKLQIKIVEKFFKMIITRKV